MHKKPLFFPLRSLQKTIAIFVSICLMFCETFAYADAVHSPRSIAPRKENRQTYAQGLVSLGPVPNLSLRNELIPQDLGTIEESYQGSLDKTIFYIQDAHDSLEAQENIAEIIRHLVENYEVNTVFEEGYEGPVPSDDYFGFIKSPKAKEKVSYFLMDKLRLGGAEYAHVNRKKDFNLIGVDSLELHRQNVEAYRKSVKVQKNLGEKI